MALTLTVPKPLARYLADGGHQSLVVERFGAILDELIAGAA